MKTYLDMDEILRHSHTYIGKGYYDDSYLDLVSAVPEEVIRSLPPADVRPVVYCKDCKHRFNYDICTCRGDNWFCGYGERRSDNGI